MTDEAVDLKLIARQLDRLIDDAARQRDDMAALSATAMRIDETMGALLTEMQQLRALTAQ
jgi:hypothetical protein